MTEAQWAVWAMRTSAAVSFALLALGSWLVSGVLARLLWDCDELFPDIEGEIRALMVPRAAVRQGIPSHPGSWAFIDFLSAECKRIEAERPHQPSPVVGSQAGSIDYLGREADRAGAAQCAPSLSSTGGAA